MPKTIEVNITPTNIGIEANFVGEVRGFPFEKSKEKKMHHRYHIVVTNYDLNTRAVFDFYGSTADYEKGIKIIPNDDLPGILEMIVSDALGAELDFVDWASTYGYDDDSLTAYRIWESCRDTMKKLNNIGFTTKQLEIIAEHLRNNYEC